MKIRFLGPVQAPPREVVSSVEAGFEGGSVRSLLEALGYPPDQAWFLSVVSGEGRLSPEDRVGPGDEVTIMLVVGGG